ncbi:77 kDa echinoderm microtubule-associated protein [Durusdinium trenchii]
MDGSAPQSVHFTMDGRCVYIAARLCIIEDLLQPRQTYFEGHNADVLCLSLAPKLDLAISGQQEPPGVGSSYACVWCPSYPSRALCRLHCFLDRSGATKGDEVPRHRDRKEGEVDFPFWCPGDRRAQLRGISAVAIAASGRFAVMMALDDKRSIILFKLPACCAKPVTSEVSQTYVIRVPTMVVASGGNICELATTNPFDSERRFRFATLNKTAVKLYEYREASNELVHGAVIFGKAPQQHLNHVAYATEAGHLLMCGKEGRLYDVHGSHVHHSAVLSHQLGCAVSLWKIKGQSYEFLAADTTGTFLLGRFEEDPPAKPRKTRPLGIRPQVAERFTLEQLPAKPGQEFPKGLRPKWRSLAVNERGLVLAASEGHMLVIFDLGLTGQRRCIWRVVQVGHKVEAWALAHHPKIPGLCASGDERGVIHFWDLEQRKPLLEKTYRSDQTVHRLEFSPEGDLLVLGQLGIVTILEFPSLQSVHRRRVSFVKDFRGQEGEVISWIVFSNYADGEDSRYLACACWDQNIYLFRLVWRTKAGHKHKGSERHREIMYRGTLTGNSSSPTHVMFTADAQFLVSNSTDLSILVWRTGTGERLHCLAAVRDMPRAGPWRNIIGWPVAGVWKKSYAQSDVNAVCQSYGSGGQPDGDVLAVADDEHMVNLYRFPAPISLSQGRQQLGNQVL